MTDAVPSANVDTPNNNTRNHEERSRPNGGPSANVDTPNNNTRNHEERSRSNGEPSANVDTPNNNTQTTDLALSCHGLKTAFNGRLVLNNLSLDVTRGEWLGIIGPNGAGKTTLLRSIAGLVRHQGSVALANGNQPTPTDVALLPQNPTLPAGMTVTEYVLLGRTAHLSWLSRESKNDRLTVAMVLQQLGLVELAGHRLSNLSGGETQQVVLARALAQQAPILLLDEPTSSLDIGHQITILQLLDKLRHTERLTVISAMHDLTTAARFADRIVLIHEGNILADGLPEVVLDAQLLSRVYETSLTIKTLEGQILVLPTPANRTHQHKTSPTNRESAHR